MDKRWLRLGALIPLISLVGQLGGVGLRTAEACSGGPGEGWDQLRVQTTNDERAAIATDGAVVLRGVYQPGELDRDAPGVWARVTDQDGAPVPGELRVLKVTKTSPEIAEVYLAWKADEELSLGAHLRFEWGTNEGANGAGGAAEPLTGESIELEVKGEPTPLPTPELVLRDWVDVRHGIGERVACDSLDSCLRSTIEVPTAEVRLSGVQARWESPVISGMVAWQVWAESEDAESGFALPELRPLVITHGPSKSIDPAIVAFEDDAEEHCAVLVVKDLWTGEERRSEPACEEPGEPTSEVADHRLSDCDEPPTPESLPLWCRGRRDEPLCADNAGGAGGMTGDSGDAAGAGGNVETPRDVSAAGGCQFVAARHGWGAAAAALMASVALLRRARRRGLTRP